MSGPERIWASTYGWKDEPYGEREADDDYIPVEYIRRDLVYDLRGYATHDDDCTINRYPASGACSCGLSAALARIGGE